jgi:hypothetical protein
MSERLRFMLVRRKPGSSGHSWLPWNLPLRFDLRLPLAAARRDNTDA